jgi:hypothetical protein
VARQDEQGIDDTEVLEVPNCWVLQHLFGLISADITRTLVIGKAQRMRQGEMIDEFLQKMTAVWDNDSADRILTLDDIA